MKKKRIIVTIKICLGSSCFARGNDSILAFLQEKLNEQDAAGKLVKFLLDCDTIEFMVGAMLNQAHYDPSLPIEIEIRRNVIKKMKKVLENNYFKRVTIHYV